MKDFWKRVELLEKKQSPLEWETTAYCVANAINCMPIARVSQGDRDGCRGVPSELDLITPNRLLLGRNNRRCLQGPVMINNLHSDILDQNQAITRLCLVLLFEHTHRFIPKPKWARSADQLVQVGDVVLFIKAESPTGKVSEHRMQMGIVSEVLSSGADEAMEREALTTLEVDPTAPRVRYRAKIEYVNAASPNQVKMYVVRSIRQLVVIHYTDELDPNTQEYHEALRVQLRHQNHGMVRKQGGAVSV